MNQLDAGTLWLVATPIGNLEDFSPRAVSVLKQVAVIACEDTRHSATLLMQFGISTPTLALHEHNERELSEILVGRLQAGESIAVISDAGTPLVSDPGFRLVRLAAEHNIEISATPGACALIMALCLSGFATDRFIFEGFLPVKSSARRETLQTLVAETRTLLFYESKHRVLESLEDLIEVFGSSRRIAIARELTKRHETILRGTLAEAHSRIMQDTDQQLGEFVFVIEGASIDQDAKLIEARHLYQQLIEELPPARAAKLAAKMTGVAKKLIYPENH